MAGERGTTEAISRDPRASSRFCPLPGVEAALFEPPSREAEFLLRHAAWLVSPSELPGSLASRFFRMVLVAPFTQLTFFSFDLQAFLFGVFHTTFWARAGHLVFMCTVNFFMLVALGRIQLSHGLDAGLVYGALLALLHVSVALSVGLVLWAVCAAALVLALQLVAHVAVVASAAWLHALAEHAWFGLGLSAFLLALSHATEPRLPPRAVAGPRWLAIGEYVLGPVNARHAPSVRLVNGLRVALFVLWGTLNEWVAAVRLMPYNFLWLMFSLGYAKPLRDRVLDHVQRALASENPALDYVGIGGATMLTPPRDAR
jgi:hypothetical protein